MRGPRSSRVQKIVLHDTDQTADGPQVAIRIDGEPYLDPTRLREAWNTERVYVWSGITVPSMTPSDDLELWLATTLPRFGVLANNRAARQAGLIGPHAGSAVALDPDVRGTGSFAYLINRPLNDERTLFEFGAAAHGPAAREIAEAFIEQTRAWDRQARRTHARFTAEPIAADPVAPTEVPGAPGADVLAARQIDRHFHRFTITWPAI